MPEREPAGLTLRHRLGRFQVDPACLAARQEQMKAAYFDACLGRVVDSCSIGIQAAYPHHTLYYRDRAGNLVATVPPEGVDYLGGAVLS
jgi:hypothetical protein